MVAVKKPHGRVWKNTRETMLLLQNGRDETIQPINLYNKESYIARNQSLFSWKIRGKKTLNNSLSLSYACLFCVHSLLRIFEEKRDCSQSKNQPLLGAADYKDRDEDG